jgi:BASS family bile acid:Na+ symporter
LAAAQPVAMSAGSADRKAQMTDTTFTLFRLLALIAVPLAAFATGVRASDPLWLERHPRLLVRSLLVMLVAVPIAAVLVIELLRPPIAVRAGLLIAIVAVGLGPPEALKRGQVGGERAAYELGLDVLLLLVAVVYVPAAVVLHGALFDQAVAIDLRVLAKIMLLQMLLPLLAGVAFTRVLPQQVEVVSRRAARFVDLAMLAVIGLALLVGWRSLLDLGPVAWLTCIAVAASAIAIGHVLGGRDRAIRGVLVTFGTVRFPALAFLVVATVRGGQQLIAVVLAYALTSAVLVGVYDRASRSRARVTGEATRPAVQGHHGGL